MTEILIYLMFFVLVSLLGALTIFFNVNKPIKYVERLEIECEANWRYRHFQHIRLTHRYANGKHDYSQITASSDGKTWNNSVKLQCGRPNYGALDRNRMSENKAKQMYDELIQITDVA